MHGYNVFMRNNNKKKKSNRVDRIKIEARTDAIYKFECNHTNVSSYIDIQLAFLNDGNNRFMMTTIHTYIICVCMYKLTRDQTRADRERDVHPQSPKLTCTTCINERLCEFTFYNLCARFEPKTHRRL